MSQRTLDLPGGLGSQGRGCRELNASLEANLGERITAEQAWDGAQPSSSKTLGASIQEGLQMYHLKSKPNNTKNMLYKKMINSKNPECGIVFKKKEKERQLELEKSNFPTLPLLAAYILCPLPFGFISLFAQQEDIEVTPSNS